MVDNLSQIRTAFWHTTGQSYHCISHALAITWAAAADAAGPRTLIVPAAWLISTRGGCWKQNHLNENKNATQYTFVFKYKAEKHEVLNFILFNSPYPHFILPIKGSQRHEPAEAGAENKIIWIKIRIQHSICADMTNFSLYLVYGLLK